MIQWCHQGLPQLCSSPCQAVLYAPIHALADRSEIRFTLGGNACMVWQNLLVHFVCYNYGAMLFWILYNYDSTFQIWVCKVQACCLSNMWMSKGHYHTWPQLAHLSKAKWFIAMHSAWRTTQTHVPLITGELVPETGLHEPLHLVATSLMHKTVSNVLWKKQGHTYPPMGPAFFMPPTDETYLP